MKPGSVIVDLAVEQGGNCPLSEPGKVVEKHGVKIVGHTNVPSRIAVDASALYAKNLLNFLTPLVDKDSKALKIDESDEIIKASMVCTGGKVVSEAVLKLPLDGAPAAPKPSAQKPSAPKPAAAKPAAKAKTAAKAKAPAKPKAKKPEDGGAGGSATGS